MSGLKDTAVFIEMLITLLQGGSTLSEALRILSRSAMSVSARRTAKAVLGAMKNGYSFSASLRANIETNKGVLRLTPVHLALIESAEQTGTLLPILRDVYEDLNDKARSRELLSSALIYPAIVVAIACIGTFFLVTKAIPLYIHNGLLNSSAQQMAMQGISFAVIFLILASMGLFVFLNRVFNTQSSEYIVFYTISFLVGRGVTLSNAISHAMSCVSDKKAEKALFVAMKNIHEGVPVSRSFSLTGYFSSFVTGWLEIADDNGKSADVFSNLAAYFKKRDDRFKEIVTRFIEPIIIVLTGIYLLILVKTIILPMLTLSGGMHAF